MNRYERQIALKEIGLEGQEKLRKARVLIVGAGGLGSPTALYLTSAGVGHITLIDDDEVSLNNLQRQVLYNEADIGQFKVLAAAAKLQGMNSLTDVLPLVCRLEEENAHELIRNYDIIVDGCDNFETRHLLDDTCHRLGKPYVYGAIQGFEGQVSVFDRNHGTKRYRDLFPTPPADCPKAVVGMTAGCVGSVQAHEVMKIICGYGDILYHRLWTIDLRTMQSNNILL